MKPGIAVALLLLGAAPSQAGGYTKKVAIVVFNGVEVLDLAGPGEVFAAAARLGAHGEERAFDVYTVSTKASVESQGFLDVTPDYSIANAPRPDILILPGGQAQNAIDDPELLGWVRASAESAEQVLTICYGAFIAGNAGLLDGLDVTTWYGSVSRLGAEFPKARPHPGRRFIDNGKVITTAGVAAGIDGSLHLVARTLGRDVADRTAEYMEYAWSPQSYTSSKYPQLNPRLDTRGRSLQQASIAVRGGDPEGAIAIYRELVGQDRADAEAWLGLGSLMQSAQRYGEAIAAYAEAANGAPQQGAALYNLACAYALSGQREKAIEALGRAIGAGFRRKATYERDPDLASIREDPRFKELIAPL